MTLTLSSNNTAGDLRVGAPSDFTCEYRIWSLSAGVGGSLWDNCQGCLCVDYCLHASLMAHKGISKLRRKKNSNFPGDLHCLLLTFLRFSMCPLMEHIDSIKWWTYTFDFNKCFPIAVGLSSFWYDDLHWRTVISHFTSYATHITQLSMSLPFFL